MSETNIESLIKRASMLEEDKEYKEALRIYDRILEVEPDNATAYERKHAIKNNTLIVNTTKFPLLGFGRDAAITYYICVDGQKIHNESFGAYHEPQTFRFNITLGNHRISLFECGSTINSVPHEIISYDFEITQKEKAIYLRYTSTSFLHFSELAYEEGTKNGGCYIATAVYGSYDCPEVWTLRRFRDNTLAKTWFGRAFIHIYYAVSPTLVKHFGNADWFHKIWKQRLDKMVQHLNTKGVSNTSYIDKEW